MLRHLREEAQPLAIDWEVRASSPLAGSIAIKVERGGLQIVGAANDAQHRATDLAGFDLLAVRLDLAAMTKPGRL
jgi:hypothetical protein